MTRDEIKDLKAGDVLEHIDNPDSIYHVEKVGEHIITLSKTLYKHGPFWNGVRKRKQS